MLPTQMLSNGAVFPIIQPPPLSSRLLYKSYSTYSVQVSVRQMLLTKTCSPTLMRANVFAIFLSNPCRCDCIQSCCCASLAL